ncbi:hypothetical protein OH77DRAFT_1114557 [Trametes cingulata]|nr:hypothetical protein OH77DRAFT_1114557 [Trametes cingulata]
MEWASLGHHATIDVYSVKEKLLSCCKGGRLDRGGQVLVAYKISMLTGTRAVAWPLAEGYHGGVINSIYDDLQAGKSAHVDQINKTVRGEEPSPARQRSPASLLAKRSPNRHIGISPRSPASAAYGRWGHGQRFRATFVESRGISIASDAKLPKLLADKASVLSHSALPVSPSLFAHHFSEHVCMRLRARIDHVQLLHVHGLPSQTKTDHSACSMFACLPSLPRPRRPLQPPIPIITCVKRQLDSSRAERADDLSKEQNRMYASADIDRCTSAIPPLSLFIRRPYSSKCCASTHLGACPCSIIW